MSKNNQVDFLHLVAHLLQTLCHVDSSSIPPDFAAKSIMIVQTVVLFRRQDHRAQSLELRHLLGEESLPGHVKFVGMATVPEEVTFYQYCDHNVCCGIPDIHHVPE